MRVAISQNFPLIIAKNPYFCLIFHTFGVFGVDKGADSYADSYFV